jgi:hypothetical protein
MEKNWGLDLKKEEADQSEEDWMFGAQDLSCLTDGLLGDRFKYLPMGEVQQGSRGDMMDCASRSPINVLETKLNCLLQNHVLPHEQWFREKGYIVAVKTPTGLLETFALSDAFIAITSGTTKMGNSIKAPIDAIRKRGVIPKAMLPFESGMSWEEYHDSSRITGEMYALGQEFLSKVSTNYQKIPAPLFKEANKKDMICLAGFAWPEPNKNGEYPRVSYAPNHAWMNIKDEYFAFDNYIDAIDGDFIKVLASDYLFYEYGYRIVLSQGKKENWWDFITRLFTLIWK